MSRPSDRNIVHFLPIYKRLKTGMILWNDEGIEKLRGCFEFTILDCFTCNSVSELTDTATEYTNFCMDMILPKKTVKVYLNKKPWMRKEVKQLVNAKKQAFQKDGRVK